MNDKLNKNIIRDQFRQFKEMDMSTMPNIVTLKAIKDKLIINGFEEKELKSDILPYFHVEVSAQFVRDTEFFDEILDCLTETVVEVRRVIESEFGKEFFKSYIQTHRFELIIPEYEG
jgi:hypothetical protein